jgi:hypothetical protein
MANPPNGSKADRMDPSSPSTPSSPAHDASPKPGKGTAADAADSLAPFHTHFAHRPDWKAAADDAAEAARDGALER